MKRTKNLQDLADRLSIEAFGGSLSEAHKKGICVKCRNSKGKFRDEMSRAEWEISGLGICCQNK